MAPCHLVKSFDNPQKQDSSSASHSGHHDSATSSGQDRKEKPKLKAVSFNMATLTSSAAKTTFSDKLGPLLNDGAPYSAIGQVELIFLADHIGISPNPTIDAVPQALGSHKHWQYGTGEHASPARRILGSIVLTVTSDQGTPFQITHLVLDGSTKWFIGRNVTRKANIEQIGRNALVFLVDGEREHIFIVNDNFLRYPYLDRFKSSYNNCNHVDLSCSSTVFCTASAKSK